MLEALIDNISRNKALYDRLRQGTPRALDNLQHAQDLKLTYTSNAIEGNTLTQLETSLVIEEGITIGGKKLKEHLEAIDHYEAIGFVRDMAWRSAGPLTGYDIRNLHALVVKRADPDVAGRYAATGRYINTETGRHQSRRRRRSRP